MDELCFATMVANKSILNHSSAISYEHKKYISIPFDIGNRNQCMKKQIKA